MDFLRFVFEERGQVAMEYLILVGFCILVIAGLASYSFVQYGDSVSSSQAKETMKSLQNAVNKVHALGDGSSLLASINLPNNVVNFFPSDRAIYIRTSSFGSATDDLVEVDANVSGVLPIFAGHHSISVSNRNGTVVLSES